MQGKTKWNTEGVPRNISRTCVETDLQTLLSSSDSSYLHLILLRYLSWPPWRDHVAKLEKEITLLSEAGCKVALVSFGTPQSSTSWLSLTGSQLDMYVDKDRSLYKMLGQVRSTSQVYNTDTIKYVTVMNIHGKDLPVLSEEKVGWNGIIIGKYHHTTTPPHHTTTTLCLITT